jgi:iron complex outermembrane receptor protein
MIVKTILLAGTALAWMLTPGAAFAQDDAAPAAQPAAADDAQAEPQEGITDIVVTAQRRTENLQRAAIAVSAVNGDTLTQASITEATNLTRLLPSLQVAPASAFTQIYLRGVGTFGANAFAEQGVAFNLDGVYLSRPAAPAGLFYDLDRIEVLKGPQGTLYGRNATGGAINVITARPRIGQTEGFVTAEYGNYDTIRASGALNLALGPNAALRISGQHAEHDGYYNDGYDDENTTAVRGQVRYDNRSGFDATLSVDYAHVGGQGSGGTIMPLLFGDHATRLGPSDPAVLAAYAARAPTFPVPQIVARNDGYNDNDFFGMSATVNVDLGFATLTVIPAYRDTSLDFVSYASSFLIDVTEDSNQVSLETRLAHETDRFKWVIGAYYFDENVTADQFFNQASNATLIQSDLDTRAYAIFGQATYSLTDTFRLTAGIRYTHENKQQDTLAVTSPFVGFVPPGPPNFVPIILNIATAATTDVNFSRVTWRAGLEWDVGPRSLLYATVSTGFKSGVLYAAQGRNYSNPETLTAYTVGIKNRFFDNTLQLNVEAFYWDYQDQQISHLGPVQVATTPGGPIFGPVFTTENAGQATIYGAEFELQWQPTRHDVFVANLQYLHTNYDELNYQFYSTTGAPPVLGCATTLTTQTGASPQARIYNVDCSGRPVVNAPRFALNLGYQHTFDLGGSGRIIAGVDTRIESSRFLSIEFLPDGRQGSYMMSNARLTWETASGNFSVTAFVNNLEDELVFSNSLQSPAKPGTIYNQIRPPRTYGLRGTFRF